MVNEDLSIVSECQRGRTEEFGRLYDKYIKKIYDFIYFKTTHKETAEDLTAQTFLKAFENVGGFDGAKGSFSAWLFRIARNTVIDHYRTRKIDANIEDVWGLIDAKEDPERDFDVKRKLAEVEAYLSKLKREQREIIFMRLWQGMSHKEIAEALGRSEASSKMFYSRAITTLRREMPPLAFAYLLLLLGCGRHF